MSLLQIISLIVGCFTVNDFVHAMQSYKSGFYKFISACLHTSFLVFIACMFSQLTYLFIIIVKACSMGIFLIALFALHLLKTHSKQIIHHDTKQLTKNMMKIHSKDNDEFSMQDAKKLKQASVKDNDIAEQRVAHHILMQNNQYHQHFVTSIKVLSRCLNISEHDIKHAIHEAFHNHPKALIKINSRIKKYNSLHPHNTFVDQINRAEQNNKSNN